MAISASGRTCTEEVLFKDRIIAVVAKDHELTTRRKVTTEDLSQFPGLNYGSSVVSTSRNVNFSTGLASLDLPTQIITSSFIDAVILAGTSSAVVKTPASLLQYLGNFLPLDSVEIADDLVTFDTSMLWAPINEHSMAHQWLRNLARECFSPFAEGGPAATAAKR